MAPSIFFHPIEDPRRTALVDDSGSMTYGELADAVLEAMPRLRRQSREGRVLLHAANTMTFIVDYVAAHQAGLVTLLEEGPAGATLPPVGALGHDILFTTGTTGTPKAVAMDAVAVHANTANLIEAQGYHSGLTFIASGPLNHFGTLSKVMPTLAVGATLRLLPGLKDVSAFHRCIDEAEGTVGAFLVPASLRMLMALGEDALKERAGKMEFIETGGAAIAQADMRRLCRLLPSTRLYNTYASTECGVVCTHDFNASPEACVEGCVGRPLRYSAVSVDAQGRVVCGGLTCGCASRPVVTSDLGHLDAQGRLHITGRADDIINVGGLKVSPLEVESAALAVDGISDCICVAVGHPITGQALKLLLVGDGQVRPTFRDVAAALRRTLEPYKVPMQYEYVDRVRRTYNGKPDRKSYQS